MRTFKLQQAKSWGQGSGSAEERPINKDQLVGIPNEITIAVDNITCPALLDTGASFHYK